MEDRIRELERQLGRKTLEAEILREALDKSRSKKLTLLARSPLKDDFRLRSWPKLWVSPVPT
ncbi:hypothetical protein LX81_03388 [Palleronia aestuarii]|uniref:Transposase n=1 Tax=Palleronia aestuarii TaxID=568105 RepID=A0A2W7N3S2_9RHOB|nr:hypothetical protein LX81_03384 [Palleronia aestuarii]PZX13011.1 hypothetical protein LX81_03388 [Palleronia aestuarii]